MLILLKRWTCLMGLFLFCATIAESQVVIPKEAKRKDYNNEELNVILCHLSYSPVLPMSDLADRFGSFHSIGIGAELLSKKNKFIIGGQYAFSFGSNVKEDVIVSLAAENNQILGLNATYSTVKLRMRGFSAGGHFGKLFSFSKKHVMGLRATVGLGLFQHKVRIQDDSDSAGGLTGDYKKGYDRLTNGLAITEFIGFQMLGRRRLINFYAGFEFVQGFTKNRRSYNFDTMAPDLTNRKDFSVGFKFGWTIPLYLEDFAEEVYY